jgi:molybdate transport system ATP-binding protein
MQLEISIRHRLDRFVLEADIETGANATGLFGHSGSGKSTLLRCIAGLEKPDTGRIVLGGETLFDSRRRIFVPPHRRRIGMVFQESRLFPHWSVRKNLRAGMRGNEVRRPYSASQVIELTGIGPLLERSVGNLSGGEKQCLSLARALLAYPRLLLMDEPVNALDARLKSRVIPFLDRIPHELDIPILYVSHDLAEVLQLCDRIVLMKEGCIACHGLPSKLLQHPEMLDLINEKELNQLISHELHGRAARNETYHEKNLPY